MPPPPPPPRRRGRWFAVAFLTVALVFSILMNLVQMGAALAGAGEVHQTVLAGQGADKVAVVPVTGLIDDASNQQLDTVLKRVEEDSAVKALVLEIDTPGGSATASDEMYHRVTRFKSNRKIPVVIAMRGMATSGGYYISAAGDYIFAEPGCLTGNIGVLLPRFNFSQLMNKYGITETTLTATTKGHSYKNAGSMFQPENPQDEAYIQGLVDSTFAQFKTVVQTGRQGKLNDSAGDIFSGKAFAASDALTRGLIDQIGYPDAAYDYAARAAGLSSRTIVRYTAIPSLLQLLTARSNLPLPQASAAGAAGETLSADGVSLGGITVDARTAAEFLSIRPLMLWRGN